MYPVLLDTPFFRIYSYGLMLSLAILVSTIIVMKKAPGKRILPDHILEAVIVVGVSGIFGSRVLYVLLNWSHYANDLSRLIQIQTGGLSFYGALFMAPVALLLWSRWRKVSFFKIIDFFAPYMLLGYSFARVGCFLNGCCYGQVTEQPWGLPASGVDSLIRHPVQLYASALALLFFFLIMYLQKYHDQYRNNLLLVAAFYPLLRFITEFFRDEPAAVLGLSKAQLFSGPVALVAGCVIIYRIIDYNKNKRNGRTDGLKSKNGSGDNRENAGNG